MRRLIKARIEWATTGHRGSDNCGAAGLANFIQTFGQILRHPNLIFAPVEGYPQQRLAKGVAVGWIEIEEILAVWIATSVRADAKRMSIPVGIGLLPPRSPPGRSRRQTARSDGAPRGQVMPESP